MSEPAMSQLITALERAEDIADKLGAVDTTLELRALIEDARDNLEGPHTGDPSGGASEKSTT